MGSLRSLAKKEKKIQSRFEIFKTYVTSIDEWQCFDWHSFPGQERDPKATEHRESGARSYNYKEISEIPERFDSVWYFLWYKDDNGYWSRHDPRGLSAYLTVGEMKKRATYRV